MIALVSAWMAGGLDFVAFLAFVFPVDITGLVTEASTGITLFITGIVSIKFTIDIIKMVTEDNVDFVSIFWRLVTVVVLLAVVANIAKFIVYLTPLIKVA